MKVSNILISGINDRKCSLSQKLSVKVLHIDGLCNFYSDFLDNQFIISSIFKIYFYYFLILIFFFYSLPESQCFLTVPSEQEAFKQYLLNDRTKVPILQFFFFFYSLKVLFFFNYYYAQLANMWYNFKVIGSDFWCHPCLITRRQIHKNSLFVPKPNLPISGGGFHFFFFFF